MGGGGRGEGGEGKSEAAAAAEAASKVSHNRYHRRNSDPKVGPDLGEGPSALCLDHIMKAALDKLDRYVGGSRLSDLVDQTHQLFMRSREGGESGESGDY